MSTSRQCLLTEWHDRGATWSPEDNQPTGQLYNVQVDDLFPYNLYGGQYRTTVKIVSRTFGRNFSGFEATNQPAWYSASGGETGRFAFNPKDPRLVYVTNYWGIIKVYDTQTQISSLISEWLQGPLGTAPRRYKFNWSAALNYSPSKPGVIYHAGTVVFRAENGVRLGQNLA